MPTKTKTPLFSKATMDLFKKACNAQNLDPEKCIPQVDGLPEKHQKSVVAYPMLVIIIEFMNEGWTANYHEENDKYWTWHWVEADEKRPSGFGFSSSDYVYDYTGTYLGSRLSFGTLAKEQASRGPLEELWIAFKL